MAAPDAIQNAVTSAKLLFDALQLTPSEKAFAWHQAPRLLAKVTDAYLAKLRTDPSLRPIAMAAAIAAALTNADEAAESLQKLRDS